MPCSTYTPADGDPQEWAPELLSVVHERAADLAGPVPRISTPAWVTEDDLDALTGGLTRRTA